MSRSIVLPCEIGDKIYDIVIDNIGKEVCIDCYIVQDVSILSIKYCDEWRDRKELGTKIFLNKEIAEQAFENIKMIDEYKDYAFFKEYDAILEREDL